MKPMHLLMSHMTVNYYHFSITIITAEECKCILYQSDFSLELLKAFYHPRMQHGTMITQLHLFILLTAVAKKLRFWYARYIYRAWSQVHISRSLHQGQCYRSKRSHKCN